MFHMETYFCIQIIKSLDRDEADKTDYVMPAQGFHMQLLFHYRQLFVVRLCLTYPDSCVVAASVLHEKEVARNPFTSTASLEWMNRISP